jgi:hypothetical protein
MWDTDAAGAHAIAARETVQNRVLEPDELGPMAALLGAGESAGITEQPTLRRRIWRQRSR